MTMLLSFLGCTFFRIDFICKKGIGCSHYVKSGGQICVQPGFNPSAIDYYKKSGDLGQ
jgi:hypothetical protein